MTTLKVLAAGSLRPVWQPLMESFRQSSGIEVLTDFGPAGLLRQRIEQGERVDLFASANLAHPQSLQAQGVAQRVEVFTYNRLCLTVAKDRVADDLLWLDVLRHPDVRVGTSTPHADPSGDYTWQLFDNIEKTHAGVGERLRQTALPLVGGPHSAAVPPGELAAAWVVRSGQCEAFIGYASYARRLAACADVRVLDIAQAYNVRAEYAFAQCHERAAPLSQFLLTTAVRERLRLEGFG